MRPADESPKPLAPHWHAAVLIGAVFGIAIWGAWQAPFADWSRTLAAPHARLGLYARVIVIQAAYVAFVWYGLRRSGRSMGALVAPARLTVGRVAQYVVVAVLGLAGWLALAAALGAAWPVDSTQLASLHAMLPHTPSERTLWVGFVLTAGICEEVVYRGYLLQQFNFRLRSMLGALPLQAVVYAGAHIMLPRQLVASVALLGVWLGLIAVWQRSLVPGMIVHVGVGLAGALSSNQNA